MVAYKNTNIIMFRRNLYFLVAFINKKMCKFIHWYKQQQSDLAYQSLYHTDAAC